MITQESTSGKTTCFLRGKTLLLAVKCGLHLIYIVVTLILTLLHVYVMHAVQLCTPTSLEFFQFLISCINYMH